MKKIIIVLMVVLMVSTLIIGCGKSESNTTPTTPTVPEVPAKVSPTVEQILSTIKDQVVASSDGHLELDEDGNIPMYMLTDLLDKEGFNMYEEIFSDEYILEGLIYGPMINIRSDMFVILKAKDGKVKEAMAQLNELHQMQVNIWSSYLPDQYEKVKQNIIIEEGNLIIYITCDDSKAMESLIRELF